MTMAFHAMSTKLTATEQDTIHKVRSEGIEAGGYKWVPVYREIQNALAWSRLLGIPLDEVLRVMQASLAASNNVSGRSVHAVPGEEERGAQAK